MNGRFDTLPAPRRQAATFGRCLALGIVEFVSRPNALSMTGSTADGFNFSRLQPMSLESYLHLWLRYENASEEVTMCLNQLRGRRNS